jgi:hypothetical protein
MDMEYWSNLLNYVYQIISFMEKKSFWIETY